MALQFTAMLLLGRFTPLSFEAVTMALKRVSPASIVTTRGDREPLRDHPVGTLICDGEPITFLNINAPAPAFAFEFGLSPNLLWPDPRHEISRHRAHLLIVADQPQPGRRAALATARALTLAAKAAADLAPVTGIVWVDSANLLQPTVFASATAKLGTTGDNALPLWVRIAYAREGTDVKGRTLTRVGTVGLNAFGIPELEYAPSTDDLGKVAAHALAVSSYLLTSTATLEPGQRLGDASPQGSVYTVSTVAQGVFSKTPVALLMKPSA